MKKLVLITFLGFFLSGYGQEKEMPEIKANFSALIVSDIEKSIAWYKASFGFDILNQRKLPKIGLKQANLKKGAILLELIQLDTALTPKDVIDNYTSKTRLQGIFKIGFEVTHFEYWLKHLTALKVEFHGSVVQSKETGKRMVVVKDPDGNRIQLFEG